MKRNKITFILILCLSAFILPITAQADTTAESAKAQSVKISQQMDAAFSSVNEKYRDMEKLKAEVAQIEKKIENTEKEIEKTEKNIAKRKDIVAERMQVLQTTSDSLDIISMLLSADSFSEMINRYHAVKTIQEVEKERITSLSEEKARLDTLKRVLITDQDNLVNKQVLLEEETISLESEVASLKKDLDKNKSILDDIAAQEFVKEAQKQKDKTQKEKTEVVQTTVNKENPKEPVVSNTVSSTDVNEESQPTTTETPVVTSPEVPVDNGRTISVVASAYSYTQPGLSNFTYTGIDLRSNPNVIAVDPSVIPLHSLVEVSGYGFAVAGDTGGAIIGNRIDVHFNTVEECMNWGMRNVTATIR